VERGLVLGLATNVIWNALHPSLVVNMTSPCQKSQQKTMVFLTCD